MYVCFKFAALYAVLRYTICPSGLESNRDANMDVISSQETQWCRNGEECEIVHSSAGYKQAQGLYVPY